MTADQSTLPKDTFSQLFDQHIARVEGLNPDIDGLVEPSGLQYARDFLLERDLDPSFAGEWIVASPGQSLFPTSNLPKQERVQRALEAQKRSGATNKRDDDESDGGSTTVVDSNGRPETSPKRKKGKQSEISTQFHTPQPSDDAGTPARLTINPPKISAPKSKHPKKGVCIMRPKTRKGNKNAKAAPNDTSTTDGDEKQGTTRGVFQETLQANERLRIQRFLEGPNIQKRRVMVSKSQPLSENLSAKGRVSSNHQ